MQLTKRFGLVAAAALLAACDSDNDVLTTSAPPAPLQTADIRYVHASPDAPDVNVEGPASTYVSDLAFKQASGFATVGEGTLEVSVDGIVPGGTATVIGPVDLALAADTAYSVIAVGEVASIDALVIEQPMMPVAAGSVRARVVHAAARAPQVDVFVTDPLALLDQSMPLGTFEFGEDLGPVDVPAGDYRIRVTAPGVTNATLFDSGTVALPDGADLLVVAVDNTGLGAAPVSLVVADGTGSFEILDADTPAAFRVIHASPDAPNVDVVVNDDFMNPVQSDVPFPAFSDYLEVPPADYNVKVTATGNPGAIVVDADVTLAANTAYSVYASDVLASIGPQVLVDDNRPVATEAKLRIVHQAPGAGLVDLYLVAPGTDLATATPAFAGVDFQQDTGYVSIAGGTYEVAVTPAGSTTPAIGPVTVAVEDGSVYTVAARDAEGGGAPFGLILLDDFNP